MKGRELIVQPGEMGVGERETFSLPLIWGSVLGLPFWTYPVENSKWLWTNSIIAHADAWTSRHLVRYFLNGSTCCTTA